MKVSNSNVGVTTLMHDSHLKAGGQVFGYVQSTRFVWLGKRTLVYRLPGTPRRPTISKPLVLFLALVLAAFANGLFKDGNTLNQSGGFALPTAAEPVSDFRRLITIGAVHDPVSIPSVHFREA
jgi:hypothetical protein